MIMYKRGRIMKRVLGDVTKQSVASDVYIWNNNVNPKVRCKMMKLARSIASSAKGGGIRTLWMHQSPVNIGPPGSYTLASTISAMYDRFIFIDDDCASPENLVNTFLEESEQFPKDMISTWGKYLHVCGLLCHELPAGGGVVLENFLRLTVIRTHIFSVSLSLSLPFFSYCPFLFLFCWGFCFAALKFLNLGNYWDRTGSRTHEEVSYAGSAQFICPAKIFQELDVFLDFFPRRFLSVTDLWLNSFITDHHGGKLRRSALPEHSSLDAGVAKHKNVAFSTVDGMRALKTEFMQYIVTNKPGSGLETYFESQR